MSTLLALPQPGPPPAAEATCAPACTACSLRSEPSEIPSTPAPPTRSKSRRLGRRCSSHKSLAFDPTIRNIAQLSDRNTNTNKDRPNNVLHASFVIRKFVIRLVVVQKRWVINQRPSNILGYRQSLIL